MTSPVRAQRAAKLRAAAECYRLRMHWEWDNGGGLISTQLKWEHAVTLAARALARRCEGVAS